MNYYAVQDDQRWFSVRRIVAVLAALGAMAAFTIATASPASADAVCIAGLCLAAAGVAIQIYDKVKEKKAK